ncbi:MULTISPECIES: hypothetical protein [unclassified Micromonospora]|uniref:hypothetical protein n=1 Tax=unclassified Micromonospora TaxID=2617518 RepID=UPI002DD97834|nr:hypothetical protein [Micromonospora sp. NBC_01813]WSA07202.1 hypothetical protein OG958_23485 [Micromonospora sp. NBC_01813]
MASIQEVKAGLIQAAEHGNTTQQQIAAVMSTLDNMLAQLRTVAAGTGHPLIGEAITRCEQTKGQLESAAGLVRAAADATHRYAGILG